MPVLSKLSNDCNVLTTRFSGAVAPEDVDSNFTAILLDLSETSVLTEIVDFSTASLDNLRPQALRDAAERVGRLMKDMGICLRTVILAPDDAAFGLGRVYAAQAQFAGVSEVYVTRTPDEAAEWLGWSREDLQKHLDLAASKRQAHRLV